MMTAEQQQRAAGGGGEGKQKHALLQRQRCGGRRGLESRVNLARRLDGSCGQEISEFCWAHAKFTAVRHRVGRVLADVAGTRRAKFSCSGLVVDWW
jgi:hypothetical protein